MTAGPSSVRLLLAYLALCSCKRATPAETAQACKSGDPAACRRLCDARDFETCEALASMYASGKGLSKHPRAALEVQRRACEWGHPSSCVSLAVSYWEGTGVERNDESAREHERACSLGEEQSCARARD